MPKCNICDTNLKFQISEKIPLNQARNLRESLLCENCGSISRDRIFMWAFCSCMYKNCLSDLFPNKKIRILESSAYRAYPKILESKFDYFNTKYVNDRTLIKEEPYKYADFQDLQFEDEYFDYILASDVFEHVRLDEQAYSEMYRTLKNNGYFIMTIPFDFEREETLIRVKTEKEKDVFLLPKEYHAGQTLVYRFNGRDIFSKLSSIGFNVQYIEIQLPEFAISRQYIFLCRKGCLPTIDLQFNSTAKIFHNVCYLSGKNFSPIKFHDTLETKHRRMLDDLYLTYLFRPPDSNSLNHYLSQLKNSKMTIDDIEKEISKSEEAQRLQASNTDNHSDKISNINSKKLKHFLSWLRISS